jgi:hypothetical protein
MKQQKDDIDINDVCITLEVESDVVEKVNKGEITNITLDITEHNQDLILETIDGELVLVIDKKPIAYRSCYLYNDGVFPYAIKGSLDYLVLSAGEEDSCLTRIIYVNTEPGIRFRFQEADKSLVEDPEGDCCIWKVDFEVVPMPMDARTYLMRWNPSISSFTEKDYEECFENMVHGMFRMNWSISDWQEARRGDMFYMLRSGDDKAGIVFQGQFLSDPYTGDDWAGSNKRRCYVDMVCMNAVEPKNSPELFLEKLQKAIPEIDWTKGHSGELLSEEVVEKLSEMRDEG